MTTLAQKLQEYEVESARNPTVVTKRAQKLLAEVTQEAARLAAGPRQAGDPPVASRVVNVFDDKDGSVLWALRVWVVGPDEAGLWLTMEESGNGMGIGESEDESINKCVSNAFVNLVDQARDRGVLL